MKSERALELIEECRVIAILRGDFGGLEVEMVEAMAGGRLKVVEVTLNSPGAATTIARLAERFEGRCAIGGGTVLSPADVQLVADAGGTFIVSPNTDVDTIRAARNLGLACFPGAFTPTEIVNAFRAGASAVKLFPANTLGPGYVRALRGPLPEVKLVPTGGVTPELAREYKSAGAWAVGIGSELVGRGGQPDLADISRKAAAFVSAMTE